MLPSNLRQSTLNSPWSTCLALLNKLLFKVSVHWKNSVCGKDKNLLEIDGLDSKRHAAKPEFSPGDPHGQRREPTPTSWAFLCVTHNTNKQTNKYNLIEKKIWTKRYLKQEGNILEVFGNICVTQSALWSHAKEFLFSQEMTSEAVPFSMTLHSLMGGYTLGMRVLWWSSVMKISIVESTQEIWKVGRTEVPCSADENHVCSPSALASLTLSVRTDVVIDSWGFYSRYAFHMGVWDVIMHQKLSL